MKTNGRSSNIELLKIIAMVLITLSHCLPVNGGSDYLGWINEQNAVLEFNTMLVLFLRHMGQVGNILFVVSSSWFLVDNSKVKLEKVLMILINAFFISVGGLVIGMFCGVRYPAASILKMIFPTTSGLNWFVGCYIILYAIHGYLNIIVHKSTKAELLSLVLGLTVVYLVICAVLPDVLYYSRLVCFITVYMIVGYMKKYMPEFASNKRKNLKIFMVLAVVYVGSIMAYLCLASKLEFLQGRAIKLATTNYFIMIFMDIALFNVFKELNISYSGKINKIASVSLIYYLITENRVLAGKLRPAIFQWIYESFGYNMLPVWILLLNIVTLIMGILAATAYSQTIGRQAKKMGAFLDRATQDTRLRFINKIMEIK